MPQSKDAQGPRLWYDLMCTDYWNAPVCHKRGRGNEEAERKKEMKTVRFAIVGFGNIAKTHINALRALPVIKRLPYVPVLDTLVTRRPQETRVQAEAIGFGLVTDALSAALAEREIDVVDVCTPNALHLEAVQAAAAKRKAVYCEKPLTDRYAHSLRLAEAAAGLPAQVAFNYRYHPAVMRIREILRQQLIGEVHQCRIRYLRSGYLDASRPVSWRLDDRLSGGGAITDLGVHVLDLFRHFFGEITDIRGEVNTFVKRRPAQDSAAPPVDIRVDDWAAMSLTTSGGVRGVAEVSRIALGAEGFFIEIAGTRGGIVCDLEKESEPRVKLLNGSSPALPEPASLELIPDAKTTLGFAVDSHFGALNHFLHRLAGEDRWEGLAPQLSDCLRAEEMIDRVLRGQA